MRENRQKKALPFWLQIVLILMTGALVSLGIWLYSKTPEASGSGEKYTVTFAYGDGSVIAKSEVRSGKGVLPPIPETDDVFRGWDSAINNVTDNIEAHPMLYTIVEDNLFYFNSVYVQEGERFNISLRLGGNVNMSSGELTLEYDPEVLTYIGADCEKLCTIDLPEPGLISVRVNSDAVLTDAAQLAVLKFRAEEKDAYSTQINLKTSKVVTLSAGEEIPADNATINNKIYFLKEVG